MTDEQVLAALQKAVADVVTRGISKVGDGAAEALERRITEEKKRIQLIYISHFESDPGEIRIELVPVFVEDKQEPLVLLSIKFDVPKH